MLNASVLRKQYAIGHGGFHAGRIVVTANVVAAQASTTAHIDDDGTAGTLLKKFYVYDCGSESRDAFDRSLKSRNRLTGMRTDILFLSHLDSDHVNKIDRLMGSSPAKIVVLPYLDSVDLTALLLREFDEGNVTASVHEYVEDPLKWWRRRGADTIIFVEPAQGDEKSPGGGPPDRPLDPDFLLPTSAKGSSKGPQARLTCILHSPKGHIPKDFATPPSNVPIDIDGELPAGGVLAGCGSYFRLEWRTDDQDGWRSGDWILLPYVHPVENATRTAFREAVIDELQLPATAPGLMANSLLEALRAKGPLNKRKKLVQLYTDHFEVDQNTISMSLYSGPESDNDSTNGSSWTMPIRGPQGYELVITPAGWLNTGDSRLKTAFRRNPWLQFFQRFSSRIFVLSLPHHGSSKDFHEEILGFEALALAVATTIRKKKRVAGLRDTLRCVKEAGKNYRVVDDKAKNEMTLECMRGMEP